MCEVNGLVAENNEFAEGVYMKKKAVFYFAIALSFLFCFNIADILNANAAESDFIIENGWLIEYTGPGGAVVVPDGVTVIGGGAFWENPNVDKITSITLPDSVVELEHNAFMSCTGMKNIRLSKKLKKIQDYRRIEHAIRNL